MDIVIVIPAYNESRRLPRYLAELASAIAQRGLPATILVVDDGSEEEERINLREAIETLREEYPQIAVPLTMECNRGKGAAIAAGWNASASASHLAFVDADGSIRSSEVLRLLNYAVEAAPRTCVFASRVRMLGRVVERKLKRHLSGRIFASLVGAFIQSEVYDSQCGFKIVPGSAWRAVRESVVEMRFAFDVDLLAALIDYKFQIEEVPIDWADTPGSKVSLVRDTVQMIVALFAICQRRRERSSTPSPVQASGRQCPLE